MRNNVFHKVFHSINSRLVKGIFVTRYNIITSKKKDHQKKKKKQLYISFLLNERGTRVAARMGAHPETVQVRKKTNSKLITSSPFVGISTMRG